MIHTLIVEDEPKIRQDLKTLIQRHPNFSIVGDCGSVTEAEKMVKTMHPELVFLDIKLSDGSGFELLQSVKRHPLKVIFMTAYNQFAIRAIKFGALDYLLKPVDEDELASALDNVATGFSKSILPAQIEVASKAASANTNHLSDRIVLRTQHYLQVLCLEEIIYCHSESGYTTFHLTADRKELVSNPIKDYEALLPGSLFIRPHQSYLVNYHFIYRYHKDGYLKLKNGVEIPVSFRKRESIINFLTGK
jgi:two-component system LytT family response regulator